MMMPRTDVTSPRFARLVAKAWTKPYFLLRFTALSRAGDFIVA